MVIDIDVPSDEPCHCVAALGEKFRATCMVMVLPPDPFSPVRTRCSAAQRYKVRRRARDARFTANPT